MNKQTNCLTWLTSRYSRTRNPLTARPRCGNVEKEKIKNNNNFWKLLVHFSMVAIRGRFWYYCEIRKLGCVARRLIWRNRYCVPRFNWRNFLSFPFTLFWHWALCWSSGRSAISILSIAGNYYSWNIQYSLLMNKILLPNLMSRSILMLDEFLHRTAARVEPASFIKSPRFISRIYLVVSQYTIINLNAQNEAWRPLRPPRI